MSAEGIARIRELPLLRLHELLTMAAQFERPEGGAFVKANLPKHIAPTLMARGYWPGIKVLYGLSAWPILRFDGSVCTAPGYDPATGLIYEPTCDVRVPDSPSRADAIAVALKVPYSTVRNVVSKKGPYAGPTETSEKPAIH